MTTSPRPTSPRLTWSGSGRRRHAHPHRLPHHARRHPLLGVNTDRATMSDLATLYRSSEPFDMRRSTGHLCACAGGQRRHRPRRRPRGSRGSEPTDLDGDIRSTTVAGVELALPSTTCSSRTHRRAHRRRRGVHVEEERRLEDDGDGAPRSLGRKEQTPVVVSRPIERFTLRARRRVGGGDAIGGEANRCTTRRACAWIASRSTTITCPAVERARLLRVQLLRRWLHLGIRALEERTSRRRAVARGEDGR